VDVRSLAYRTDLLVRRLAGSDIADRRDHVVVRTPANPSFYWGNFVLVAPLVPGDARRWLDVFSAEFPGAGHVAIGVDGSDGDAGDVSELTALGLAVDTSVVLTASALRRLARPNPEVTFRPLVSDDDWRQTLDLRVEVAIDEGHDSAAHRYFLQGRVDEARQIGAAGRGVYFGAFVDGQVRSSLGLVVDGAGPARFQNVETHHDFRRQGLAGGLVYAAGIHGLDNLGANTLVIVADAEGPAIGLYRSLGFVDTEYQVELSRPH
jgi:ribosomal protein S18 acetylase RimI-like enzyme